MNNKQSITISGILLAALAHPGAQAGDPGLAEFDVYIDGATSANAYLQFSIIDRVCDGSDPIGSPIDLYVEDEDDEAFIINCNLDSSIDAGNALVNFVKRDGISYDATVPLATAATQTFLDPATVDNCAAPEPEETAGLPEQETSDGPVPAVDGTAWNENEDCDIDTKSVAADMGVTLTEAGLHVQTNVPGGSSPVTPATLGALESSKFAGGVSGVVVTKNAYYALQAAQFGELFEANETSTTPPEACYPGSESHYSLNDEGVPHAESLACMVTLTTSELRGLLNASGSLPEWELLFAEGEDLLEIAEESNLEGGGAGNSTLIFVPDEGTNPGVDSEAVVICRRPAGSGIAAALSAYLLNDPCTAGIQPLRGLSGSVAPFATIAETPGELAACMNDVDAGTNLSGLFDGGFSGEPPARRAWGIGMMLTDQNLVDDDDPPGTLPEDNYRYIRINRGGSPTGAAVWQGDYEFFTEAFGHRRSDGSFNNTVGAGEDTKAIAIFDELFNGVDGTDVAFVVSNFESLFADDDETTLAWMAIPDGDADTPDAAGVELEDDVGPAGVFELKFNTRNPTNTQVKNGNSCQPPIVSEEVEIDLDET